MRRSIFPVCCPAWSSADWPLSASMTRISGRPQDIGGHEEEARVVVDEEDGADGVAGRGIGLALARRGRGGGGRGRRDGRLRHGSSRRRRRTRPRRGGDGRGGRRAGRWRRRRGPRRRRGGRGLPRPAPTGRGLVAGRGRGWRRRRRLRRARLRLAPRRLELLAEALDLRPALADRGVLLLLTVGGRRRGGARTLLGLALLRHRARELAAQPIGLGLHRRRGDCRARGRRP